MDYINKAQFRQQLIDRQITTQFFNPKERHEIGCIIEMLDSAPSVDAVEVVRCKDCKYHRDLDGGVKCDRMDGLLMTLPNDYCSYGRGRTENDES